MGSPFMAPRTDCCDDGVRAAGRRIGDEGAFAAMIWMNRGRRWLGSAYGHALTWHTRVTTPRASGMPNAVVLFWFPLLMLVLTAVAAAAGVSGSSRPLLYEQLTGSSGSDAGVLFGNLRAIRSDEWVVQSGWIASQAVHGFSEINPSMYGGLDSAIYNDAPAWSWSMVFRPHAAAFLFLPLANAFAVWWWLPLAAALSSAYVFVVLLLPRAPFAAACLAVAAGLSPIVQWWYLPGNIWPIAFGFALLSAVIVASRARRKWPRFLAAGATGYIGVTTMMAIYFPYIIAVLVPAAICTVGWIVHVTVEAPRGERWAALRRTALPLVIAGFAASVVFLVWLWEHRVAVSALLNTAYPGDRHTPSGSGDFGNLIQLFSAPFQDALYTSSAFVSANQSEASTAIMISLFLCVPLVACIYVGWRVGRRIDAVAVAVVFAHALILAFLYIPHLSRFTHLFLLDLTTANRARMAFVFLLVVTPVVLVTRLRRLDRPWSWSAALRLGGAFGAVTLGIAALLWVADPGALSASSWWVMSMMLLAGAIVAFARARVAVGSIAVLLVACLIGGGVNPLTRGFVTVAQTEAGSAVQRIRAEDPGAQWVNVGGMVPMAVLFQSGVVGFGGVQNYPNTTMWNLIDPAHRFEFQWNRLAHVRWVPGSGEPTVSNPAGDVAAVTFDSCSEFAQHNVGYVLSDTALSQQCVQQVGTYAQGGVALWIYKVVPSGR
ncbi:hypothetical protein [uncultured Microbacterium sp.]|nr:hypothetical protein [uncultured Microbacterium sp.]